VTFIGAKDQIAKQLIARGDVPRDHVFHCSGYIAKTVCSTIACGSVCWTGGLIRFPITPQVMNCIGDLFSGARAIQDWLTLSARLVSRCIPVNRLQYAVQDVVNNKAKKGPTVKSRMPKELMTTVTWTTPLQLPVVQPYRKPVRKQVRPRSRDLAIPAICSSFRLTLCLRLCLRS
jgi:DNA-directed RNA polymerase